MATLREFLVNRRTEILAEIKSLRAELKELEAAEAALSERALSDQPRQNVETTTRPSLTLKEMAIEALKENSTGLDANAIRQHILTKHGLEIKRSSLSPQLSRLEKDYIVARTGSIYRINLKQDGVSTTPFSLEKTLEDLGFGQSEGREALLPGPGTP